MYIMNRSLHGTVRVDGETASNNRVPLSHHFSCGVVLFVPRFHGSSLEQSR